MIKVLWYGPLKNEIQTFHDGPRFEKFLDALDCVRVRFGPGVLCRKPGVEGITVENEGAPVACLVIQPDGDE